MKPSEAIRELVNQILREKLPDGASRAGIALARLEALPVAVARWTQLCKAICRRGVNAQVSHELDLMIGEKLVEYFDATCFRYSLTVAGRNEAARVAAALKKGKAA